MELAVPPSGQRDSLSGSLRYLKTRLEDVELGSRFFPLAQQSLSELVGDAANVAVLQADVCSWYDFTLALLAALWHTRTNGGEIRAAVLIPCPVATIRLLFRVEGGNLWIEPPPSRRSSSIGRLDHHFHAPATSPVEALESSPKPD